MAARLGRREALASLAAGGLWLLVWAHQLAAHGPTARNDMRLVLGLTWMDSAKLLVLPLLLLFPALAGLARRRGRPGRLGRLGQAVSGVGLGLLAAGAAAEFWTFPWGSYAQGFEGLLPRLGGVIQSLASLVFGLGLGLFGFDLARARVLPMWAAAAAALGGLATFFLTPASALPGLAWLVLGWVSSAERAAGPGARGELGLSPEAQNVP